MQRKRRGREGKGGKVSTGMHSAVWFFLKLSAVGRKELFRKKREEGRRWSSAGVSRYS